MQQLHLVGITTDLDGLIFSARRGSRSGSFVVPITDELLDSLSQARRLRRGGDAEASSGRGGAGRRGPEGLRQESRLTPREMQARLRAGHTLAQVARAAGMGEEWVERFAAPILAEQERILGAALAMKAVKGRVGESAMPLAESVRINLHDKGVPLQPTPEGWTVQTLGEGRWLLRFEYVSRRREQSAEWELDLPNHELVCRNRLAGDIGFIASVRRRVPAEPEPPEAAPVVKAAPVPLQAGRPADEAVEEAPSRRRPGSRAPTKKASSKRAPARKAAARKAGKRQTTARKVAKRRAAPRKAAPRKAAPRKAAPRKAAPRKAAPRKAAPRKAAPRKAAARKAAARKAPRKRAPAPPVHTTSEPTALIPVLPPPPASDQRRPDSDWAVIPDVAELLDEPPEHSEPAMFIRATRAVESDLQAEDEVPEAWAAATSEPVGAAPTGPEGRWRRLARPLRSR